MPHIPDPRYEALADACRRRYPPPAGHVLPVLTREGEGRAGTPGPAPFDILTPDFQARLVIVEFTPWDVAAQLHALTARGLVQADPRQLGPTLMTLIAVELMLRDWKAYRPDDDRAVMFWVHLGQVSPEYTFTAAEASAHV